MNDTHWTGTCAEVKQRVDAYLDGEMQGTDREIFESHLRECGECAAEVEANRRLKVDLKAAVNREEAPHKLRMAIRQKVRQQGDNRVFFKPGARWVGAWSAAAAAAVLAVILWPGAESGVPAIGDLQQQNAFIQKVSLRLASVFRPGLQDHLHCAVFRAASKKTLPEEVIAKELGEQFAPLAPLVRERLTPQDHLLQAHRCSYQGRHFAHVVMRRGSALISLVVTPKQDRETFSSLQPVAAETSRLYGAAAAHQQITGFETRDYLVFLVSDLEEGQNLQLAERVAPFVTKFLDQVQPLG